jgi:hypothetical protein
MTPQSFIAGLPLYYTVIGYAAGRVAAIDQDRAVGASMKIEVIHSGYFTGEAVRPDAAIRRQPR